MGNVSHCLTKTCQPLEAACVDPSDQLGVGDDYVDDLSVVPVGVIFDDTLELLTEMDQQLLQFCGGTNLVGVRWLFRLGAGVEASDLNGTTALHVACRTGSLAIVKELVGVKRMPLDICDLSGWTPLHVAITMSRRAVVLYMLKMKAPLDVKTNAGKTPLAMCNDPHIRHAITAFLQQDATESFFAIGEEDNMDTSDLQFEPFFVPRTPCLKKTPHRDAFVRLGQNIFNKQPGQGLAFLVAVGCVRDYPIDISIFLRRANLDKDQIGKFLGESLSMSHTLRLEFINSVRLINTGIVASLSKVFSLLTLPRDLGRIDRIVHSIAVIWWRQHARIAVQQNANDHESAAIDQGREKQDDELKGFALKQYFSTHQTLYQLMFSAVMLHVDRHEPAGTGFGKEQQRMGIHEWLAINRGLEGDGQELIPGITNDIFNQIVCSVHQPLALTAVLGQGGGAPHRGVVDKEDCAMISGSNPSGNTGKSQDTSMQTVMGKAVLTPRDAVSIRSMLTPRGGAYNPMDWFNNCGQQQRAWISLCRNLLFISARPCAEDAPYAFVDLQQVSVQRDGQDVVLRGASGETHSNVEESQIVAKPELNAWAKAALALAKVSQIGVAQPSFDASDATSRRPAIPVIFLLPDGRWQELPIFRLQLEFVSHHVDVNDTQLAEQWANCLRANSRRDEHRIVELGGENQVTTSWA